MQPQVVSALKAGQVVELLAVGSEIHAAQVRRVDGKASHALVATFEHQFQGSRGAVFLLSLFVFSLVVLVILTVLTVFLIFLVFFVLLLGRVLGRLHAFLIEGAVFLVELGKFVGFLVQIHDVDVIFSSPASVTAIACAVGSPDDGLSAQGPLGLLVAISALGEVDDLLTVDAYGSNVVIVPAAAADVRRQNPAAVGRPAEVHVAVGVREIIFGGQYHVNLLALHVVNANLGAVGQEGNLLAVGRIFGQEVRLFAGDERLFLDVGGVSKVLVLLVLELHGIDIPRAVSFGSVNNGTSVGADAGMTLSAGSSGEALGGGVVHGLGVEVAFNDESNFLFVLRYVEEAGAA